MELDTGQKVQLAKASHKAKGYLDGLRGQKTDEGVTKAPDALVHLVGIGGTGVAIVVGIVSTGGLILDVVGFFLVFFAPYMMYQKHLLAELGSFRSLLNDLRLKINDMMHENDLLAANVKRLSGNVDELEKVENELSKIVGESSVDDLVNVAKEHKEVNEKIKNHAKSFIVQQLISTVIRADRDSDLTISHEELQSLMISFEAQSTFTFHKFRFIQLIGAKNKAAVPMESIMRVIRNIKDDTIPEHTKVFSFNQ